MHIILLIVGVLGALAFWWFRIKQIGQAGSEALDTAQRARGYLRRRDHARKGDFSPVTAIDDPVVAAATLAAFVAGDDGWPRARAEAGRVLADVATGQAVEEALGYADWAHRQIANEARAIDVLTDMLNGWLNRGERDTLRALVDRAAARGGDGADARADRTKARLIRN